RRAKTELITSVIGLYFQAPCTDFDRAFDREARSSGTRAAGLPYDFIGLVKPSPPRAKVIPHISTVHGDSRVDDYFWMRDKDDADVVAYLRAENAYTESVMKATEDLQQTLYREIVGRIKETDLTVPVRRDDYFYYTRTEQGKQYSIYCRK